MSNKKCTICLKVKGKRQCKRKDDTLICSRCCAELRNHKCSGCPTYAETEKYLLEKLKKSNYEEFINLIDDDMRYRADRIVELLDIDVDKANVLVKDFLDKYPDIYLGYFLAGGVSVRKNKYEESIIYFDKAIDLFPYYIEAWLNKGSALLKCGRVKDAILAFHSVLRFATESDYKLVEFATDRLNDIRNILCKGLELTTDAFLEFATRHERGIELMDNGEFEKAIDALEFVLELGKNHYQSLSNIGLCYAFLGNKKKAIEYFDKALAINPEYEPALINRETTLNSKDGKTLDKDKDIVLDYQDMLKKINHEL